METVAGTAGTVACLHSAHHAGRALGHHYPVPLPADPFPPTEHMEDKTQQHKKQSEALGTLPWRKTPRALHRDRNKDVKSILN